MSPDKHPTFGNGKICYLEIPSVNTRDSANFYQTVFGWHIRQNDDGSLSFDDTVGEVSGMWTLNRQPGPDTGILISIMVSNIRTTMELITINGGRVLHADVDASEKVAKFSDPSGNIFCLYQSSRAV